MRNWFIVELFRRVVLAAGLMLAGYGMLEDWPLPNTGLIVAIAFASYIFMPREQRTPDAETMAFIPAVYGLDLAGLLLSLPLMVVTMAAEFDPGMPDGWMVAIFVLPVIIAGWVLFWMAARNASLWVASQDDHLRIATAEKFYCIQLGDIEAIEPHSFSMPKWSWMLLALFGGPRGAGMALLHGGRKASYLKFRLRDGRRFTLPADEFPSLRTLAQQWQRDCARE